MADAVAARREARRRKILENSQNRLQLISGKPNHDCVQDVSLKVNDDVSFGTPVSLDSCSSSSRGTVCNGTLTEPELFREVKSLSSLLTRNDVDAAGDGELVDDIASFLTTSKEQPRKKILWEKLSQHKYDVVILSLFMQLLHSFSLLLFDNFYYFLPLIIYTITKTLMYPPQKNSIIANAILLLHGTSRYTEYMILTMQLLGMISQDVCIYLFTTVCLQCFLLYIKQLPT